MQVGRLAINYLSPGLDVGHDAFIMIAIRKHLTGNSGRMQPDIIDDIRYAIDNTVSLENKSWKKVRITKVMENVVLRSTSRLLVGSYVCQKEEYLSLSMAF